MQCPKCNFSNPSGFRYCGECGAVLSELSPELKKEEAERRQITVMFCDLVGFTSLSGQIDPEELREIVTAYQRGCAEIIYKHGGHIAQYLGDGLLVYFGYPITHEDTAQRAVRAGLEIVEAVHRLALPRTHLQKDIGVRVGIHTGVVVVGEVGGEAKHEWLAVGEAPNVASKLQEIAGENEVVISSETHRLLEGEFKCESMGLRNLKGIGGWVEVYRVIGERRVRSRFGRHIARGLTPLVGREEELRALKSLWERVRGGVQVVMLRGEAGIGKSRMVHELREKIKNEESIVLECQCLENYQNSAFYPLIELLERMMGIGREDTGEEKIGKIEDYVGARCSVPRDVTVPLFASLLSLPIPEGYPPIQVTPQRQKEKTIEALYDLFVDMAVKQPVLFVVEDLQWVDPSTLEFLNLFIDSKNENRILILLTSRPESPDMLSKDADFITLDRLNERETGEMTESIAKGKTLPSELLRQVVAKSDGIPLYVEEITKMVMEQDLAFVGATGRSPVFAIPSTLQDSLMARLDRLSTVKEVAQIGAAIGREFSYELLKAISTIDDTVLQRELDRLVEAELLLKLDNPFALSPFDSAAHPEPVEGERQAQGRPVEGRDVKYSFKHALIRDAAYQSLLKSKRQQYHQRIAEVLEERYQETIEIEPEIIAHHYTEAGIGEKAIPYWTRAGQNAVERSANIEAVSHLKKALQLLEILPETPNSNEKELTILVMLGSALALSKGFSNPEVEENYNRALELCRKVGGTPHLFPILMGLSVMYSFRDLKIAIEMTDKMFKIAESAEDPSFYIWCHSYMGTLKYWQGELDSSLEHINAAIAISETEKSYNKYGFYDPILMALCYKSWILLILGYAERASSILHQAQVMAQAGANLVELCFYMAFTAMFHCKSREVELTLERSEELVASSTEFGLPFYMGMGKILRGWALIMGSHDNLLVKAENIIKQMWQGIRAPETGRDEVIIQVFAPQFAEVYLKIDQVEVGLNFVNECLANLEETGFCLFEGELNRFKGKFLLALLDEGKAEECFLRAIEIARRQKAKLFELCAVMDLSRLWMKQGKKEEARNMLAEIYGWFTEGFDTKDLQEAKILLNELSK
ncbi:MAG TPA: adenylate/guanylate cyclase domain-containing protein [Thermodesulfobacteriota bacterium]|nr:adenylate/guanylate cyclase domain-containing protein [Thermodesulfobacteriota bacterium]